MCLRGTFSVVEVSGAKAASERLSDPVTVSSALAAIQAVVVSAKDNSEDVYFAQVVPSLLKIVSGLQSRHLTVASYRQTVHHESASSSV